MSEVGVFVVPARRGRKVLLLVGFFAFVAVSVWLWTIDEAEGGMRLVTELKLHKVAAVAGVGFFGACVFAYARLLLSSTPMVVVDSTGVTDNASLVAVGFVPWRDLGEARIVEVYRNKFVAIEPRSPEVAHAVYGRLPWLRRVLARANRRYGLITLPQSMVGDVDELLRQIEAIRPTRPPPDWRT